MSAQQETPFDSIEGTYEYIDLLVNTIKEVRGDIDTEIARAGTEEAIRRKEALQLVAYNLIKLETHITRSRRILNDLRSLRRLLLQSV